MLETRRIQPGPESRRLTRTPFEASAAVLISNSRVPSLSAVHRFDGVDDQVEDHLLQLDPVRMNERQALRELRPHPDAVLHHFAAGQGDDLNDRLVDLQALLPRGSFLDEGPDPADDLAGTFAVIRDLAEDLPDLAEFGWLAASQRKAAWALSTVAAIGWLTSWATEAVSCPIVATRLAWVSSACAERKASSARLRSVMCRPTPR